MLTRLRIQNLAVIAECEIAFEAGFTVLTGETGAGKSIIIDAISMLMGQPADEGLIRTGADSAVVEGTFSIATPIPELTSYLEDTPELVVYRRISREKPGVMRLNGITVPLKQVRSVMNALIGITGQHDQLALFGTDHQLRLVDQFAVQWGIADVMAQYRGLFKEWTDVNMRYEALRTTEGQLAQKIDFLQFQIDDIGQYELKADEEAELNQTKKELNQHTAIGTQLRDADQALAQMDTAAQRYIAALKKITPVVAQFTPLLEAATTVLLTIEEHSEQVARYQRSTAGLNDMDIDAIESRLDILFKLKTKYKALDVPALVQRYNDMIAERDELLQFEATSNRLESQRGELQTKLRQLASDLHEIRTKAALHISDAVSKKLSDLGFNQAHFEIKMSLDLDRLTPAGTTAVEMQIAPNPGEGLKPLGKVASGGELSRIMLAVNSVFFELNPTPTLIFDEVDAGVGGLTALRIGEQLKLTAVHAQVFCITHLPQIAQHADTHLLIEKQVADGQTFTTVRPLGADARTNELKRMVGGDQVVARVSR